MPPDEYVKALADVLKPGGLVIIYNIGPGPGPDGRGLDDSGERTYVNMADIRCPFPRATWEAAGFEIIAIDEPDTAMIRRWAATFGWDQGDGAMNLETDLFASYTIAARR